MEFIFAAIAFAIFAQGVATIRGRGPRTLPQQQPMPVEDPRVAQLQAEVDELRTQVQRLAAAESFYAQLGAPASAPSAVANVETPAR
ncbi:MAG TPA: hypothetical protein VFS20_27325 [Longimicrobium sp.]|nr:hypothetical protein [Longimicrobium sp.]